MVRLNQVLTHSLLFAAPHGVPPSCLPARAAGLRMVATSPPPPSPPSSSSSLNLPPLPSPFELAKRLTSAEARALQKELLELALDQDPQVIFRRSLDLARALRTVGTEAATAAVANNASAPLLLRRLCEELGATYVKLGQFIASSPTLFPPEFVQEFQKTLDQTPPMPWSVVKPLIESELGRPLDQVYASVEQTPLAAASIAQVHAAKLRTGEDVVIKVQKRGVQVRSLAAVLRARALPCPSLSREDDPELGRFSTRPAQALDGRSETVDPPPSRSRRRWPSHLCWVETPETEHEQTRFRKGGACTRWPRLSIAFL